MTIHPSCGKSLICMPLLWFLLVMTQFTIGCRLHLKHICFLSVIQTLIIRRWVQGLSKSWFSAWMIENILNIILVQNHVNTLIVLSLVLDFFSHDALTYVHSYAECRVSCFSIAFQISDEPFSLSAFEYWIADKTFFITVLSLI